MVLQFVLNKTTTVHFPNDRWYFRDPFNGAIWIQEIPGNSDHFRIGIDELLVYRSGEVKKITVRSVNTKVKQGSSLMRIESDKPGCCGSMFVISLGAPADLTIERKNPLLETNIEEILHNCYTSGWLLEVVGMIKRQKPNFSQKAILVEPQNENVLRKTIYSELRNLKLIPLGLNV